jgi:predicted dehydrogenase
MAEGRPLGAVIVGTGIGVIVHVPALRAAGIEVRAVVGRDPDKTAARAAVVGVPNACTDLDEALALPGVDIVTIATPPFSHPEVALRAIAAGKHVLCEKPLARDLPSAVALFRAAEKAGVIHLFGTEFRYFTPNAVLRRVVREGRIGEPRFAFFQGQMSVLADLGAQAPSWFADAEGGGSWLVGAGSHVLDQIRCTLGDFERVSATLQTLRPRVSADDLFAVHFGLRNGVEGVYLGTAATRGPRRWAAQIDGTGGTAWVDGFDVWFDDGRGPQQAEVPPEFMMPPPVPPPSELIQTAYDTLNATGTEIAPYTKVYEILAARVRGITVESDPEPATFADGVALQAVIDAIRRSATEHTTVTVDLPLF